MNTHECPACYEDCNCPDGNKDTLNCQHFCEEWYDDLDGLPDEA